MSEDKTVTIVKYVVLGVVAFFTVAIGSCTFRVSYQEMLTTQMVLHGADPMEVACAFGSQGYYCEMVLMSRRPQ